jgi:hypothetical protein
MLPCRAPDHHDKAVALDQCISPVVFFNFEKEPLPSALPNIFLHHFMQQPNSKFTRLGTTCAKQAWQIALPKAEACY